MRGHGARALDPKLPSSEQSGCQSRCTLYNDDEPQVSSYVDIAGIVTIDNDRNSNQDMDLLKKLMKPAILDDNMSSNNAVLCLCTGMRHDGLLFGQPGHQVEAVERHPQTQ